MSIEENRIKYNFTNFGLKYQPYQSIWVLDSTDISRYHLYLDKTIKYHNQPLRVIYTKRHVQITPTGTTMQTEYLLRKSTSRTKPND